MGAGQGLVQPCWPGQWQRARDAELPHATFIESYAVPLFPALPRSHDADAIRLWKRYLHGGEAVGRLPPETGLLVARKMMYLAKLGDSEFHREDLIQDALTAADRAVAILERKATIHPEAFEPGLAAALSTSAKLRQDAGRFEAALSQIEKCLDLLGRLAEAAGETEAILKRHGQRRWALLFLLRARDSRGLLLLEHVEALRAMQDPSLDDSVRSNALGAALEPLAAAEARAKLGAGGPWIRPTWFQNQVSVQVDVLWDPEFSARFEHRALRLQWLRACPSDRDIAQHALAARTNGMLSEVESIGKELLSLDRQLERALGVSLLAWHPEADRWLEPLLDSDPSAWVRRHAEWAITVCRRDRLGRQIYREALSAATWLEQQARFEQLVPLVLPTFSLWPLWDEEISELTKALTPRRRALLIDFRYRIGERAQWKRIAGRDLERFCRGDDVSTHLGPGEKGPPWLRGIRST